MTLAQSWPEHSAPLNLSVTLNQGDEGKVSVYAVGSCKVRPKATSLLHIFAAFVIRWWKNDRED